MNLNVGQSTWNASPGNARRLHLIGGRMIAGGAIAYILHVVMRSMLTAGVDPVDSARAGLWIPVNALGAAGAVLVLLGLPAIADRLASRDHARSLLGFALLATAWSFFGVFLSLYGAIVMPWLADRAPELLSSSAQAPTAFAVAFALGLVAWLAGAVLIAIPHLKGESRPRWIGYLLPLSAIWFMIGSFVIAPDGPASNLAVNLLSNLGPVLLLVALAGLGSRTRNAPR